MAKDKKKNNAEEEVIEQEVNEAAEPSKEEELQKQLEGTENRISVERKKFNTMAQDYNTTISTFPNNLIASMFGFEKQAYFKADEAAKTAPKVQF